MPVVRRDERRPTETPETGIVRRDERRRTETPNAVMTTLASPTLGGATDSMWQVDMRRGQAGPPHTFDTEQVWTVLSGGATVELDGGPATIQPGDTIVIPPGVPRQVRAHPNGLAALVFARAGARAAMLDGTDRGVPDWIA